MIFLLLVLRKIGKVVKFIVYIFGSFLKGNYAVYMTKDVFKVSINFIPESHYIPTYRIMILVVFVIRQGCPMYFLHPVLWSFWDVYYSTGVILLFCYFTKVIKSFFGFVTVWKSIFRILRCVSNLFLSCTVSSLLVDAHV